jgi:hypothetical protein
MNHTIHDTVELAHTLAEKAAGTTRSRVALEEIVEVIEAALLALVAVATAWSGYQAARWDGRRAELYATSSKLLISAQRYAVIGGQEHIYDTLTFNAWLGAKLNRNQKIVEFLEQRFRPEYHDAFLAWMKTNPFHSPHGLPGPSFMPEYHNAKTEGASKFNSAASSAFDEGTQAGVTGDRYVRMTVLLATVLLLTAVSQRFRMSSIRTVLLFVAFVLLAIPIWSLFTLPRL